MPLYIILKKICNDNLSFVHHISNSNDDFRKQIITTIIKCIDI